MEIVSKSYTDGSKAGDLFRVNKGVNRSCRDVLGELRVRAGMTLNLSKRPNGTRCLLYFAVNYDVKYLDLLAYSLNALYKFENTSYYDVLVICPAGFEGRIRNMVNDGRIKLKCMNLFFMHVPMAKDGVEASMNKLKIYKWGHIADYERIMFVDADVVFVKPPCEVFALSPTPGILHSTSYAKYLGLHQQSYFGISLYSRADMEEFERRGIYAFNAGQFYFLNSEYMLKHLANVDWLTTNWPGVYFFEQSFMNFYFNSMAMSDINLLYDKIQLMALPDFEIAACKKAEVNKEDLIALHFAGYPTEGKRKMECIREYFKTPELKENKGFSALSLVRSNSTSEFNDDENGRYEVLNIASNKFREAEGLSHEVLGKKKLVYYTAFGDVGWFRILELSMESLSKHYGLFADVLVLTDEKGRDIVKGFKCVEALNLSFMVLPEVKDGVEASMNKLKIWQYERIREYESVLFIDSDIMVTKPLHGLFYGCEKNDKVHVAYTTPFIKKMGSKAFCNPFHSLPGTFGKEDLNRLEYHGQMPFNAGQFLFHPTEAMLRHFENVDWMTEAWPSTYFFEQSFMNYYFCNGLMTDNRVFDKHVCILHLNMISAGKVGIDDEINNLNGSASLIHFAGNCLNHGNKLEFIEHWLEGNN